MRFGTGVLRRFSRCEAVVAALVAVVAALCVAASGLAAATPVEPAPGGTVTEPQPTFRWSLPPGEKADRIELALSPDTMPSGEFVDANILDFDDLQPTAIRVGWFGNAEHVKVDARVYRVRRVVWADEDAQGGSWSQTATSRFVFGRPSIRRGTGLRLVVTLSALNQKVTKTLPFHAP